MGGWIRIAIWMGDWADGFINGSMCGWTEGWMDGYVNEMMGGWMDG